MGSSRIFVLFSGLTRLDSSYKLVSYKTSDSKFITNYANTTIKMLMGKFSVMCRRVSRILSSIYDGVYLP